VADIGLRDVGEERRAARIEAEGDDRLVGALIEGGLRIGEIIAGKQRTRLDHHRRFFGIGGLDELAAGWRRLRIGRGLRAFHMERHLRRLAENLLQLGGVLQARHLHEDALAAFSLDRRLRRSDRVDAPLQHLDALRHGGAHARLDALVGEGGGHAIAVLFYRDLVDRPATKKTGLNG
jgi:hypothetical protein